MRLYDDSIAQEGGAVKEAERKNQKRLALSKRAFYPYTMDKANKRDYNTGRNER
jgi:hypothetical protein